MALGQKSRWSKEDVGPRDARGWEEVTQAAGEDAPPTGGDGGEGVCVLNSSIPGSDRASLVSSELHSRHVFMSTNHITASALSFTPLGGTEGRRWNFTM